MLNSRLPLVDALSACVMRSHAPFYTPGHKRGVGSPTALQALIGSQALRADLPELPELDNLCAPQGVIEAAQALAAQTFGAERTWFLVNGSTCGIVAAILATCEPGDKIILPRNVHQSAIAALILSGAIPVFIQPEYDLLLDLAHSITPETVAATLDQHPDVKAVLMVYPTYFGVGGDIRAIADLTHRYNIPLLVDEAHGAHFAFHPNLPISALDAGADLSVQSTHKTLAALTQASMLHVQGDRIDRDRVSQSLQFVQSTSPSYLLLASLDAAREQMATQGQELMERTLRLADEARSRLQTIPKLATLTPKQATTSGFYTLDRTRLTVTVSQLKIDGFAADKLLHQQLGVTAELPSLRHVTFIFSLGNTEADVERLVEAWETLAASGEAGEANESVSGWEPLDVKQARSPREAFFARSETVGMAQACDRVSAELVCPYPPGIPVLMPGERITQDALNYLQHVLKLGGFITGCTDSTLKTWRVIQ
ncbi:aminotransferase class I/II-fold pyridoxal phosphate-dependent enzyme [Myxacorys almedinensis]|uniref:Aminotransferase class I/II-fold pyridoxal phosphate-dependent enzyme n=1 Tax=Myxacorys almedinensis A TaxID=2690445 RepID=A0A8J8CHL1_9CYAN|nr:aminotransferase class I/II-fold pyridoxal phosphate-dependent enzyme [Myxacorys almedinensis]NDJ16774.1 aminotransferase class I/II-fold pyridoxal phosphate-dependent enzyme [Myxacorys almedinensis A]